MVLESNTYIDISPYHEILSGMHFILSISVGVVKLTGTGGSGKTRLLEQLQNELQAERQETILFLKPPASIKHLHDTISRELKLDSEFGFNKALIHHIIAKPYDQQRLVIAFDDAHKIDIDVLLAIALFRNITHNNQPIISIVLCGSEALNAKLEDSSYRPLVQDMLLSYELNPLTREQLQTYGNACADIHRLGKLPLKNGVLTELLAESKGLPGAVPDLLKQLRDRLASGELTAKAQKPGKAKKLDAREYGGEVAPAVDTPPPVPVQGHDSANLSADEKLILASRAEKDASERNKFKLKFAIAPQHRTLAQGVALAAGVAVVALVAWPRVAPTVSNLYTNLTRAPEQQLADIPAAVETNSEAAVETPPAAESIAGDEEAVARAEPDPTPASSAALQSTADTEAPQMAIAPPASVPATTAPEPAAAEAETAQLASAAPEPEPATATAASAPALAPTAASPAMNGNPDELQQVIREWLMAWEEQDVDDFFSYYHTDFAPLYQDTVADWRTDRQSKISRPDSITIELEEFTIGDSSTIGTRVSFWMNYETPGYADRTRKELLIGRDLDGQWRILQEYNQQVAEMAPSTFRAGLALNSPASQPPSTSRGQSQQASGPARRTATPVPPPASFESSVRPPPVSSRASFTQQQIDEIARFLAAWLTDWQNQDVDGYFSHYESGYKSASMASVDEWRNDRITKISRPTRIVLRMDELEILTGDDNSVRVQLVLEYHSTHYADRTVKEIELKKAASGEWRIADERNRQVDVLPLMRLLPVDSLAFLVMNH